MIKVSERPDTIFTNDKADFGSTRTGGNGTAVGEQDMSPVSRSRQLRALGIEDSTPANTLPSAVGTNSSEATPLHVILQKASDSNPKRRLFNNSRDIPLDMEYNMPDDDGAFFAHLPIISYLDQKKKSIGKYNCPVPTTLKSKNTTSRRRIGKNKLNS